MQTKTRLRVQFQEYSPAAARPFDGAMTAQELVVPSADLLPAVGDTLDFFHTLVSETSGPHGAFRVRSRHFSYTRYPDGNLDVHVNVVVEPITASEAGERVKE